MDAEIWAQIKRLKEVEHLSIRGISRRLKVDRKTVRAALEAQNLPIRKSSPPIGSKLDLYKETIQDRIKEYPQLKGTRLYEEIKSKGYTGSKTILKVYLRKIRPKNKEVFLRIETFPGDYGQVDWANCGTIQIGNAVRKLSCFVMVLSYSRMMYLEFTLSQCLEDFIACHIHAFEFFGGIPRKILYDNLKTVCLSRLGTHIRLNPKFLEFSGIYLFEPVLCNPGRGNEKGKVESGIKYIRSSFLEGKSNLCWPNLMCDTVHWRDKVSNTRIHGTTRESPIDRFQKEKNQLQRLPAQLYDPSIICRVKATSQSLIHFDGNAYSVPYLFAYKNLLLKATIGEIRLFQDRQLLATHCRSFERGVVIEDSKHYEGLLAEKKKAFTSKIQEQFLNLGELSKIYIEGLRLCELNLAHHIAQIMECVCLYGKAEVLQAMDHALKHKAYGAPYLKNIILQQRAARGVQERVPITIPHKPAWTQLCVEEQDLSLYDDLFNKE